MIKKPNLTSATAAVALLWAVSAWARVGGGNSYSGGHAGYAHSGGGGGSGNGALLYFLVDAVFRLLGLLMRLTITHPLIGLPLDCLVIYVIWKLINSRQHGYDITNETLAQNAGPSQGTRLTQARHELSRLAEEGRDPDFSRIVLQDFLHALYSTVHHARAGGKLGTLSGYLSPQAIASLEALTPVGPPAAVNSVIVGAANITQARVGSAEEPVEILVEFEGNYAEAADPTHQGQSWYAHETWKLTRKAGVRSRPPQALRQIACPACGAPAQFTPTGQCAACGKLVRGGDFDWYVEAISSRREQRPPLLTTDTVDQAWGHPTLIDPDFATARAAFEAASPDFKWERFNERVSLVFGKLQSAWSERKWETVRPFESDCIFETHSYWILEYHRQKLVNTLKDVRIQKLLPVKIEQDRYFTAITVRIFASMIDSTQTEDGKPVCGDASRTRPFTEYWTFMRGRSAQPPKAGDANCPACGAPLKINMAGSCEYCHAKVCSGNFDWVLSAIEQDESYAG